MYFGFPISLFLGSCITNKVSLLLMYQSSSSSEHSSRNSSLSLSLRFQISSPFLFLLLLLRLLLFLLLILLLLLLSSALLGAARAAYVGSDDYLGGGSPSSFLAVHPRPPCRERVQTD